MNIWNKYTWQQGFEVYVVRLLRVSFKINILLLKMRYNILIAKVNFDLASEIFKLDFQFSQEIYTELWK